MGYVGAIAPLLTFDPNFQRDIQVVGMSLGLVKPVIKDLFPKVIPGSTNKKAL